MTSAMTLVHLTLLPLVLVATVSGLREQELQCEPIKIEQVPPNILYQTTQMLSH